MDKCVNHDGGSKTSKGAKISNRYNQVPPLTQDTNGKVTNSQINRRPQRNNKHKTEKKHINYPQKKLRPGTVSKNILLEGPNQFHGDNLYL